VYKPDSTDWEIIALLNEDWRMPSSEIARRLGTISARTVTNRIKLLTKQVIIHISAIIRPSKVGYNDGHQWIKTK
jgi:Lrp/AsnC family transcriptional regulator for asnA, asnC and gidA